MPDAALSAAATDAARPYDGVRVIELAEGIAGPYAGRWLAALGADVIKVEPLLGDASRAFGPWPGDLPDDDSSGLFLYLNGAKRSLTLNLDTSDGRAILSELAATADIVIESFTPGYLAERGLAYDDLARERPQLVMASITPFGQTGPNAELPATELTMFAACGQAWLTGDPNRPPLKNGGSQPSYQAGLNAFAAISAAAYAAIVHGQGAHIDLAIVETYAGMAEAFMTRAAQLGVETQRSGNNHSATWGLYPTADGYGGICALPRNLPGLLAAVDSDELRALDVIANPNTRAENNDEIMAILYAWFAERTPEELIQLGIEHRVPFGYVASFQDLSDNDHLAERGYFTELRHGDATLKYPARLWAADEYGWSADPAPKLGQHLLEILAELGYDAEDAVRLRELNAV